jgi:hypothetical protein
VPPASLNPWPPRATATTTPSPAVEEDFDVLEDFRSELDFGGPGAFVDELLLERREEAFRRRHSTLGMLSPAQFESHHDQQTEKITNFAA